jgi:hypothetical protein
MKTIEIHEFSTGIEIQGTPDNWWSQGFIGYMNSTLQEIPAEIQHSISNRLFEVGYSNATNNPAIIAREVEEKGDAWSIVAVVTRAKDEKGRTISVYRYFLTQGLGQINDLLTYQQINKLVFDPFDHQEVGKPHLL